MSTNSIFSSISLWKIENIHKSISLSSWSALPNTYPLAFLETTFSSFKTVTIDWILKLAMTLNTETCTLDPIPTFVFKRSLSSFSPIIFNIMNISLTTGIIPKALKFAAITPVLKTPGCDKSDLSNYRPISSFSFSLGFWNVSLWLVIQLFEPFQSVFRKGQSTETVLVWVMNNLLVSADSGAFTILVLLVVRSQYRIWHWTGLS